MKPMLPTVLVFLLFGNFIWSQTDITDATKSADLKIQLEKFEDAGKKLSIDDIVAGKAKFTAVPSANVSPGFTRSAIWLKLPYSLNSEKQWVLELEWPHLELVDFFVLDGKTIKFHKMTGHNRDPTLKDYLNRNFIFDLPQTAGKPAMIFVRVETRLPLLLPITLRTLGESFLANARDKMFYGFVFGVLTIMLFYNFFLFLTLKDRNYLYYIIFSASIGLYSLGVSGYMPEFIPHWPAFTIYVIPISVGMVWLTNFLFIRAFLDLKRRSRILYRTYSAGIVLMACAIPATFLDAFVADMFFDAISLVSSLMVLISSGYIWITGHRSARYIFLAFFSWVMGIVLLLLRNWGFLPSNFLTTHTVPIGSMLEISLFSLALADRVNLIKAEKAQAQREALESQMQAVESLKKADAIKDTFLAHTSHELRTPLQGIMGLTESLLANLTDLSARENAGLIMQSARRLSNLINDILDYSRMKEQDIILNLADLDLGVQVDKVMRSLEFASRSKGVPICNGIQMGTVFVQADEQRLQQILFNLIGNALKFTAHGSINVQATAENGAISICVSDTGAGIPADQIGGIFQRFGRIESHQATGTGLGLTITKSLVELHGGKITVKSTTGSGSAFTFTLPAAQSTEAELFPPEIRLSVPASPKAPVGSKYVLIIDDDPFILRSTSEHLRRRGFEVATAHDGASARIFFEAEIPPMLVVLDLMLPDVSGIQLCREFREKYAAKVMPILMLTARSEFKDFLSAANAGANDYLTKPFETADLFLRIDNLLTLATLRRDLETTESEYLRRVYEDMHDHLGSLLTDISAMTVKLREGDQFDREAVQELQRQSAYALRILRERLQAMADLAELTRDFFGSLNAQLLRRYANAGRTLRFIVDENVALQLGRDENMLLRREIYLLVSEIATNDLKYGLGDAVWSWGSDSGSFRLRITTQSNYNPAKHKRGLGTASVANRVAALGGRVGYTLQETTLVIDVEFRIFPGETS
ncbi:MAG: 7TM diverse intracellular signaling domain-containing protein [Turneriella sp.]